MRSLFRRPMPVVLGAVVFLCSIAKAGQILVNGDFEAGNLSGWTVTNQNVGRWLASNAAVGPLGGLSTVGASSGAWYALADANGPGAHALTQPFTVAPGSTVVFSFDMFVSAYAAVVKPASLDYTVVPNEQGRVDLLTSGATPFDVGAGVLFNFYDGADAGAKPNPYVHYSFDISTLVAAGGTYQIRFAETDNQGAFNMGIDNVVVNASGVPEPGTVGLAAIGLIGVLAGIRRKTS